MMTRFGLKITAINTERFSGQDADGGGFSHNMMKSMKPWDPAPLFETGKPEESKTGSPHHPSELLSAGTKGIYSNVHWLFLLLLLFSVSLGMEQHQYCI